MLRNTLSIGLIRTNVERKMYLSTAKNKILKTRGREDNETYLSHDLRIIEENVNGKQSISFEEWRNIKNEMKAARNVTAENADSIILKYLMSTLRLDHGKEYVEQLRLNGFKFNLGFIGNIMQLYYLRGRDIATSDEKLEISQLYDDILAKYKVMDMKTSCSFACGFLVTDEWRKSLEILKKMKEHGKPTRHVYNSIIETAFHHQDANIGWKLLQEMSEENIFPDDRSYISWLKYSLDLCKNDTKKLLDNLEKMLNYCGYKDLPITINTLTHYKKIFSDVLGWKTEFVTIAKNGHCGICNSKLQTVDYTADEFKLLQKTFHDNVLVGRNAFSKSSPKERECFLSFVDKNAPFDVVLDGLNIMYSIPRLRKSELLINAVNHFLNLNKKICLIGRKHITSSLSQSQLRYIQDNTHLFLVDDLSYDDIFILHASLIGQHTMFISRDVMRSHKFLLNDNNVKAIFKKWQRRNQLSIQFVEPNGKVHFKRPMTYLGSAQKGQGWHVPYILKDVSMLPDTFELPTTWVCLQPPNNQEKR